MKIYLSMNQRRVIS